MSALDQLPDFVTGGLRSIGFALAGSVATVLAQGAWRWHVSGTAIRHRDALERINISFNYFSDDTLRIRTIVERPLEEVVYNVVARRAVRAAARAATKDAPILEIEDGDVADLVLKCVLNTTSGHFSGRAVRPDLNLRYAANNYAIFLTSERPDIPKQVKIRALIIQTETLEHFRYEDDLPKFENPAEHLDRLRTLRLMAKMYRREKSRAAQDETFRSNVYRTLQLGS